MYFFNSVDRSNLGNAKTDGMDKDLGFKGEEYSLLILLFYIPNGLCDLPLNMLTKKYSGKVMLPSCKLRSYYIFDYEMLTSGYSDAVLGCHGTLAVCGEEFRGHASIAIAYWCERGRVFRGSSVLLDTILYPG